VIYKSRKKERKKEEEEKEIRMTENSCINRIREKSNEVPCVTLYNALWLLAQHVG
jgi:hypothetical protein